MTMIQNPILPGFNPDPCIVRKGGDFYIATSTFEWFGGVQIHHSKDLVNWRLLGRALNRTSQIDLKGDPEPQVEVPAPNLPAHPFPALPTEHHFDGPEIPVEFQSLRIPFADSWVQVDGKLTLIGQESLSSRHHTSLVARRVEHHSSRAETTVHCDPGDFQHMAGLTAMYSSMDWLYLHVTRDDDGSRVLRMAIMNNGAYREAGHFKCVLPENGSVDLACEISQLRARWQYRVEGGEWVDMPNDQPAENLSDEAGDFGSFTGTFVGMACQDISGERRPASFSRFSYNAL